MLTANKRYHHLKGKYFMGIFYIYLPLVTVLFVLNSFAVENPMVSGPIPSEITDGFDTVLWKEVWNHADPVFEVKNGKLTASDGGRTNYVSGMMLEKYPLENYIAVWKMTRLADHGTDERAIILVNVAEAGGPRSENEIWMHPVDFPIGRPCGLRLVVNNGKAKLYRHFLDDKASREVVMLGKDNVKGKGRFGFFHYNRFDYEYDDLKIIPLDNSRPVPPRNLTAAVKPDGTVLLDWSVADGYENVFQYGILRADNRGMSNNIMAGETSETEFADRKVPEDTTLYYQVAALNGGNPSGCVSSVVEVKTGRGNPPGLVRDLIACPRFDGGVSVSWKPPAGSRYSKFRVYKKENNDPALTKETEAAETLVIDDKGGQGNEYGVAAVNPEGKEGEVVWVEAHQPFPLTYAGAELVKLLGAPPEENWRPPEIKKVDPGFTGVRPHPRLLYTQEQINAAKEKINKQDWARKALAEIVRIAEENMQKKTPEGTNARSSVLAFPLAAAYSLTGEEKYAEKAKEYLLYYADNYKKLPLQHNEGRVTGYQFTDSCWLTRKIVPAYDLIYNSKGMSDDDRRRIENDLLRPAAEDQMIDRRGKDSAHHQDYNFQTMRINAVGLIGFCLNEPKYIDWAVNSPYGFFHQVARNLRNDGLWWEKTISYHVTTACPPLYELAEAAYNNNLDLWHTPVPDRRLVLRNWNYPLEGDHGPKTLQSSFDALLYLMFPDCSAPSFGDAVYTKWYGEGAYYLADKHYPAERYKWFNTRMSGSSDPEWLTIGSWGKLIYYDGGKKDTAPFRIGSGKFCGTGIAQCGSTLFPSTGYAVLRRDETNPDSTALAFTYGPQGVGHNNGDKLSFLLYAKKSLPIYKMNYRQGPDGYGLPSVSGNTVVADEISHWAGDSFNRPNTGKLDFFYADNFLQAVGAQADVCYQDIFFRRALILGPGNCLVDIFICRSPNEHQYDYVLHVDSFWDGKGKKEKYKLGSGNGYQFIEVLNEKTTAKDYRTAWSFPAEKPRGKIAYTMLGGENTVIFECLAPAMDRNEMRAAFVARRKAKNTVFISVMEVFDEKASIKSIEMLTIGQKTENEVVVGLKISRKDSVEFVFYSEPEPGDKNPEINGHVFWSMMKK